MECVKLLFYNNFYETLVCVYTYLFTYNFSLTLLFLIFCQFLIANLKTLYSFNDLKFNAFSLFVVTVTLFSMAGVPPFIGFFAKLLLLITTINSNFIFYFLFFFILLFLSLYFYLQNLRFLYSTGQKIQNALNYTMQINARVSPLTVYYSCISSFYLTFGFFFMDDTIFYFN